MALQGIRRIAPGIVQDLAINSGRPSTLPVGCCWGMSSVDGDKMSEHSVEGHFSF